MISMGMILRLTMILGGVILLLRLLFALAGRKMTEVYSVPWVLFSLFLIAVGIVIRPEHIERYIGWRFFILMLLFCAVILEGVFRISLHQSELYRKNTELSMQIALLNQEYSELCRKLRQSGSSDPASVRTLPRDAGRADKGRSCDLPDGEEAAETGPAEARKGSETMDPETKEGTAPGCR